MEWEESGRCRDVRVPRVVYVIKWQIKRSGCIADADISTRQKQALPKNEPRGT